MVAFLVPFPKWRAFDSSGNPLSGGKVYTYQSATTTPKATFTDATGTVPNANPTILDAAGEAHIWFDGIYRVRLDSALDVNFWTVDGVTGGNGLPTGMTVVKTTGVATAESGALQTIVVPALVIPANVLVLGVVGQVTSTFGSGNGLSALHVGDGGGGLVDRYFSNLSPTAGAVSKSMTPFDSGVGGLSVILTPAGGAFDATGAMSLSIYYVSLLL